MNEIKFFIDVFGENFNPEELKQLIGIETILTRKIGDRRSLISNWDTNYLSFRNKRADLQIFSEQLLAFFSIFDHKKEEIK